MQPLLPQITITVILFTILFLQAREVWWLKPQEMANILLRYPVENDQLSFFQNLLFSHFQIALKILMDYDLGISKIALFSHYKW